MLLRLLAALSFVAILSPGIHAQSAPNARVVGYYFGPTLRRNFPVNAVKAEYLTHLNYAFAGISEDGRAVLGDACIDVGECGNNPNPHKFPGGNFAALRRLKQQHPHLRTLISVGGWGGSARFSDVAATAEARRRFVQSLVQTFFTEQPGVFDGVDLDWEFPVEGGMAGNRHRPEDRANYTLLVTDIRRALNELERGKRKRYLVTIGVGAASEHVRNLDVPALSRVLDFINVMTYDYHSGGTTTHFNAPLAAAAGDPTPGLNVRASIDAYIAAGAPPSKLVVGVPFYGYGYVGVDSMQKGRFQTGTSSPPSSTTTANQWAGAIRYYRIAEALRSGFTRHWDARAGVPWLYNARTRTWITYDDIESIGLKINLVGTRKLGGIMIWELSGDDGSLLPAIHRRLKR